MDQQSLEIAKQSAIKANVGYLIHFERANAMKLPYSKNSLQIECVLENLSYRHVIYHRQRKSS